MMLAHALHELRGGMRHLRLFFACLCLAVGVMSCIGSLTSSIRAGIDRDAKALLGGDIEITQIFQDMPSPAVDYMMFHSEEVGRVLTMRAMAQAGVSRMLAEIKGVDEHYPLYGELDVSDRQKGELFFNNFHHNRYGAVIDGSLMRSLSLTPGSIVTVGTAEFKIQGVIRSEPDRGLHGLLLGPHVLTSLAGFRATGLAGAGSMVDYRYRIKLPGESTPEQIAAWESGLATLHPISGWQMHDWKTSAPSLRFLLDRIALFFSLTGLTTLAIAGIGIGNAANTYLWSRRETIAVMKCLGANRRHIYGVYLLQLLIVSAVAISCGLILGTLAELLALHFIAHVLPVEGIGGVYPAPLALSALFGLLTVALFSLLPLQRAAGIRPILLFRDDETSLLPILKKYRVFLSCGTLIIAMTGIAMLFTETVRIPLYFAGGIILAAGIFHATSRILRRIARQRTGNPRLPATLRMALAGLARPDAATGSIIVALGISMTLLIALALVGGNLRRQLNDDIPAHAPAFFLADIQPSQRDELLQQLNAIPGMEHIESRPVIRGHIVALNGQPVEKLAIDDSARWALQGERALTSTAEPPEHTRIVAGTWWDAHYPGMPLVSIDANLARGMGLHLGDTITIAALDRTVTATIASLRDIAWGSLEMNFTMIFSPGALDGLPYTYIASVDINQHDAHEVGVLMEKHFPEVAVIRVHDILGRLSDIVSELARAVLLTACIAILCGILVMAGALHGVMQKRLPETVILKVLGITRWRILAMYACEFALVLLAAGIGATLLGTLAAYALMQLMIFTGFTILPGVIFATLAACLLLAIVFGLDATRTALAVRPLSVLRDA